MKVWDWLCGLAVQQGSFTLDSARVHQGQSYWKCDYVGYNLIRWTSCQTPDYAELCSAGDVKIVALVYPKNIEAIQGPLTFQQFMLCFYAYQVGAINGVGVAPIHSPNWWKLGGMVLVPTLLYAFAFCE
jgi:hypothetical protein